MLEMKLEYLEQAYLSQENEDGSCEYQATATDERGNIYLVTWRSYKNWDLLIDEGLEDDVCDWNTPYSIQLIKKAEEEEEEEE